MAWLPTYAGYGLPRAELFAQLRAEEWGWTSRFPSIIREGSVSAL